MQGTRKEKEKMSDEAKKELQDTCYYSLKAITAEGTSPEEMVFSCLYFALVQTKIFQNLKVGQDIVLPLLEGGCWARFTADEVQAMRFPENKLQDEIGLLGMAYTQLKSLLVILKDPDFTSCSIESTVQLPAFSGSMRHAFWSYDVPVDRKNALFDSMSSPVQKICAQAQRKRALMMTLGKVSASLILGGVAAFFLWPVLAEALALAATAVASVAVGLVVSAAAYGLYALASAKKPTPSTHPKVVSVLAAPLDRPESVVPVHPPAAPSL